MGFRTINFAGGNKQVIMFNVGDIIETIFGKYLVIRCDYNGFYSGYESSKYKLFDIDLNEVEGYYNSLEDIEEDHIILQVNGCLV